jgi:hypothetical protein
LYPIIAEASIARDGTRAAMQLMCSRGLAHSNLRPAFVRAEHAIREPLRAVKSSARNSITDAGITRTSPLCEEHGEDL